MSGTNLPDLGAQDPEHENSPILDDDALEDLGAAGPGPGTGACYFNGTAYGIGQYVRSGSDILRCDEGAVWIRKGSIFD